MIRFQENNKSKINLLKATYSLFNLSKKNNCLIELNF